MMNSPAKNTRVDHSTSASASEVSTSVTSIKNPAPSRATTEGS